MSQNLIIKKGNVIMGKWCYGSMFYDIAGCNADEHPATFNPSWFEYMRDEATAAIDNIKSTIDMLEKSIPYANSADEAMSYYDKIADEKNVLEEAYNCLGDIKFLIHSASIWTNAFDPQGNKWTWEID